MLVGVAITRAIVPLAQTMEPLKFDVINCGSELLIFQSPSIPKSLVVHSTRPLVGVRSVLVRGPVWRHGSGAGEPPLPPEPAVLSVPAVPPEPLVPPVPPALAPLLLEPAVLSLPAVPPEPPLDTGVEPPLAIAVVPLLPGLESEPALLVAPPLEG